MIYRCPGQDPRNIKIETIRCPSCGYGVEIFSDEISVSCPKCRTLNRRKKLPSCLDWCKSSDKCIGEDRNRIGDSENNIN